MLGVSDLKKINGLSIYPNPFNSEINIEYTLLNKSDVLVEIYSIGGRLIKILNKKKTSSGRHKVKWDGIDSSVNRVRSGLYLCKISLDDRTQIVKLIKQ